MNYSKRLKDLREDRDLTQAEVAKVINTTYQYYSTYESGKRQELELYYVDNCSLWLDIKIIFKTLIGVFKRDGAK